MKILNLSVSVSVLVSVVFLLIPKWPKFSYRPKFWFWLFTNYNNYQIYFLFFKFFNLNVMFVNNDLNFLKVVTACFLFYKVHILHQAFKKNSWKKLQCLQNLYFLFLTLQSLTFVIKSIRLIIAFANFHRNQGLPVSKLK